MGSAGPNSKHRGRFSARCFAAVVVDLAAAAGPVPASGNRQQRGGLAPVGNLLLRLFAPVAVRAEPAPHARVALQSGHQSSAQRDVNACIPSAVARHQAIDRESPCPIADARNPGPPIGFLFRLSVATASRASTVMRRADRSRHSRRAVLQLLLIETLGRPQVPFAGIRTDCSSTVKAEVCGVGKTKRSPKRRIRLERPSLVLRCCFRYEQELEAPRAELHLARSDRRGPQNPCPFELINGALVTPAIAVLRL